MPDVTVAIPVLNGGALLDEVLGAVRAPARRGGVELLVCDSGSTDGSVQVARAPRRRGDRDRARQLRARADAQRADRARRGRASSPSSRRTRRPPTSGWLARLLGGLRAGRATSRSSTAPTARARRRSPSVARELEQFFAAMAPDGARGRRSRRRATARGAASPPARRFFTDANGAVARRAWERVPLPRRRPTPRIGCSRCACSRRASPRRTSADAVVLHSHDLPTRGTSCAATSTSSAACARRSATSSRLDPRRTLGVLRREVAADRRWRRAAGADRARCRPRYPALRPPLRDPRAGPRSARARTACRRPFGARARWSAARPSSRVPAVTTDSRTEPPEWRAPRRPRASLLVRVGARPAAPACRGARG